MAASVMWHTLPAHRKSYADEDIREAYLLEEASEEHPHRGQIPWAKLFLGHPLHLCSGVLLNCLAVCLELLYVLLPTATLQAPHLQLRQASHDDCESTK